VTGIFDHRSLMTVIGKRRRLRIPSAALSEVGHRWSVIGTDDGSAFGFRERQSLVVTAIAITVYRSLSSGTG
jgi:hypothetical protein